LPARAVARAGQTAEKDFFSSLSGRLQATSGKTRPKSRASKPLCWLISWRRR